MKRQLGGWWLEREIGRGAYGTVYLAVGPRGERAAVKVCRREDVGEERYERELRGVKLYRAIPPQNGLVRMRGLVEEDWGFYTVMDLADDEFGRPLDSPEGYRPKTLASVIDGEKALPLKECAALAISLADGLAALQRHHLLHRDIKPGNVLYVGGCPVLSDPGLVVNESAAVSTVGTPVYLPPEGKFTEPASDIYSLGITLKAASFGRQIEDLDKGPAMEADTGAALFPAWWRILNKATDPTPSRRYQSAKALVKDLKTLRLKMSVMSKLGSRTAKVVIFVSLIAAAVSVAALVASNNEMNEEVVVQKEEIAKQRKESAAQRAEIYRQHKEMAAQREKIARQDNEMAAQREKIARQDNEMAAQRKQIARQDNEMAAQREKIAMQDNEMAAQRKQIDQQNKELSSHRDEISRQQERLKSQDEEIASQLAEMSRQGKEIERQREEIAVQRGNISEQMKVLARQREEIARQRNEINRQRKEVSQQAKKIAAQIDAGSLSKENATNLTAEIVYLKDFKSRMRLAKYIEDSGEWLDGLLTEIFSLRRIAERLCSEVDIATNDIKLARANAFRASWGLPAIDFRVGKDVLLQSQLRLLELKKQSEDIALEICRVRIRFKQRIETIDESVKQDVEELVAQARKLCSEGTDVEKGIYETARKIYGNEEWMPNSGWKGRFNINSGIGLTKEEYSIFEAARRTLSGEEHDL